MDTINKKEPDKTNGKKLNKLFIFSEDNFEYVDNTAILNASIPI